MTQEQLLYRLRILAWAADGGRQFNGLNDVTRAHFAWLRDELLKLRDQLQGEQHA